MAQATRRGRSRGRLSLSLRLSLLILFAALVPLAAVVGINDFLARDTLITQAKDGLTTDSNAKVSQIDLYLNERLQDGDALRQLTTTPMLLSCMYAQSLPPQVAAQINAKALCDDPNFGTAFDIGSNCRGLNVGAKRDPNYTTWAIFDGAGHPLIAANAGTDPAQRDANGMVCPVSALGVGAIDPKTIPTVVQGKQWISPVSYDTKNKFAYVQVYTPVVIPDISKQALGFLRATLRLDKVWSIVNSDAGANGEGSAAFITDENGVRIATTNPDDLFSAVRPLGDNAGDIAKRFGLSTIPTPALPEVQSSFDTAGDQTSFQGVAEPGTSAKYQYLRTNMTGAAFAHSATQDQAALNANLQESGLQWSYFVLSPLSTITAVSDSQVRTSLISAAVVAIIAVLIGLLVGRGTTRPVRASVTELEGAAAGLKALAVRQQSSAGEQHWVVDACKTGLESVRYLSDAMNQATRRIIDASNWFGEYWDRLTEDQARRTVAHLQELAHYIDEAARRQQASSDRLDKAITVTMQVSDQLVAGASAATESAGQLEQVVNDLQHVVGGKATQPTSAEEEGEHLDQMGLVPVRQDLPPAALPRQLPAPTQQPVSVRAGRGGPSGRSEYPQYSQYPQAPYGPYADGNGDYGEYGVNPGNNANPYGGGSRAGYSGDRGSQWGRMPPDGRSRGNW